MRLRSPRPSFVLVIYGDGSQVEVVFEVQREEPVLKMLKPGKEGFPRSGHNNH